MKNPGDDPGKRDWEDRDVSVGPDNSGAGAAHFLRGLTERSGASEAIGSGSTPSPPPPLPDRVVGTARYIWCSHWPAHNCPAQRWSEMARTVGRSSSRITSPQAPAYAARTCEELSPTHNRRSPVGARQATALQSWAPVDPLLIVASSPPGNPVRHDLANRESPPPDCPGLCNSCIP